MKSITHICVAIALMLSSVIAQNYDVSSSAPGYRIAGGVTHTKTGLEIPLAFNSRNGKGRDLYGKTIEDLVVSVDYETADRLHVKVADKDGKQYIVPKDRTGIFRPEVRKRASSTNYEFKYTSRPFGFQVIRKSDRETIFDTTDFPLVFEDQYLELSSAVPDNANLYGVGEVTAPFRRNNERNVTTIFARDAATPFYGNVYGSHPYYTEIRNGKAHGSLLLNAHGMDVFFSEGRVTYKVIGGILDFYFFVPKGGKPNSVVQAYTDLIGKPTMPALWMLGWHHCRYGYQNIEHVEWVVQGYKDANIPLEVAWIDIDYMDRLRDFTLDPVNFPLDKVKAFSDQLHKNKQRFVTMIDPAIQVNSSYEPYTYGRELDIFIKNNDGSEFIGQVWPGYTAFPDWWHPNVSTYWSHEIGNWMKLLNVDGLWIDMNEPSSFCLGSCGSGKPESETPPLSWELPEAEQEKLHAEQVAALDAYGTSVPGDSRNLLYPKYAINNGYGNLSERTVSMTVLHYGGIPHYDLHNLYGHAEGSVTRDAILKYNPKDRPFVLTRSTFVGSGQHAGHWTGDNYSLWEYLKNSLAEIFNFQMFGISLSGADVCGFNGNATEQLCTRWMEIGAMYPFARNHNSKGQSGQEPFLWNSTAEASRKALGIRYTLLPYYYTLFEESHRLGTGVWRPLIFEYPQVPEFLDNAEQVLVGSDILLSPVLAENATTVEAAFPPGIWYDWYTFEAIQGNKAITLDAPLTHIPVHIRGGAIVPCKTTPELTVQDTFAHPYMLLIALDSRGEASGRLYIDDTISLKQHESETSDIRFTFNDGVLSAKGRFGYPKAEKLGTIKIIGEKAKELKKAEYRGLKYDLQEKDGAVVLEGADISLSSGPFVVKFY